MAESVVCKQSVQFCQLAVRPTQCMFCLRIGGICCIDEFDGIKEADKVSIHEVMEQQTLSISKAGLITTLTTRTSIFGSMNPRGNPRDSIAEQTGLSGPLLSRFDILLPVHDTKNADQDELMSGHILNNHQGHSESAEQVNCRFAQLQHVAHHTPRYRLHISICCYTCAYVC